MAKKKLPRGGKSKIQEITSDIDRLLSEAEESGNYLKITNYCRFLVESRKGVIERHYAMKNIGELSVRSLINSRYSAKSESGKFIKIANAIDEIFMQLAKLDESNVRFASFTYGFASAISLFSSIIDDKDFLVQSKAIENQKTAQKEGGEARGSQLTGDKERRIDRIRPYVLGHEELTNREIANIFLKDWPGDIKLDTASRYVSGIKSGKY